MKIRARNYRYSWGMGSQGDIPLDGFFSIFEPIKEIDQYEFKAWTELESVLSENGIVLTENGYRLDGNKMIHILVKDNQIIGYASEETNPATGEYLVIIDTKYSIVNS